MVQFNFAERTIKAKLVYYGPPQSGKTTNLEQIHRLTDPRGTSPGNRATTSCPRSPTCVSLRAVR